MQKVIFLLVVALVVACNPSAKDDFDLQGHRGARGLLPENSIPGFIKAIDLGVTTLELDLAVTKDSQLVISHEPYMSAEICSDDMGNPIPDSLQHQYNIFQMTYMEVRSFDCGSKSHARFPDQQKLPVSKPLLSSTIGLVLDQQPNFIPRFNIEIKSRKETDHVFHPDPESFADLLVTTLEEEVDWDLNWANITIQSFDFRVLQYMHLAYPHVTLALLIDNDLSIEENLDSLGFSPEIYSCDYSLLSQAKVDQLHMLGIKVIPWTVNEKEDMAKLILWGVDGLITDYPDRYIELRDE